VNLATVARLFGGLGLFAGGYWIASGGLGWPFAAWASVFVVTQTLWVLVEARRSRVRDREKCDDCQSSNRK
jgi:hypothetical protein